MHAGCLLRAKEKTVKSGGSFRNEERTEASPIDSQVGEPIYPSTNQSTNPSIYHLYIQAAKQSKRVSKEFGANKHTAATSPKR
mmetsp:Transcript_25078/g.53457  ORF Transcript_25078/g.53457 Transcript_25078/m.53457 type:complete len:83 (+) Transcript_25078:1907-2155(+)